MRECPYFEGALPEYIRKAFPVDYFLNNKELSSEEKLMGIKTVTEICNFLDSQREENGWDL